MTEARDHFVYRTYNADGELLYVGCTMRLKARWSDHKVQKPWMVRETARCRIAGPYTKAVARDIERAAIRAGQPLYGWTPDKHREDRIRSRWINQKLAAYGRLGMDFNAALKRAIADADEQFPDPNEHEHLARLALKVSAA